MVSIPQRTRASKFCSSKLLIKNVVSFICYFVCTKTIDYGQCDYRMYIK